MFKEMGSFIHAYQSKRKIQNLLLQAMHIKGKENE